jgi:DNA-directed RNA polymerase specialized sigma24 family protein
MTDDLRRWFEQVHAVRHAAIHGYALLRTGNADDAADVIAETFLTAWRRIDHIPAG